MENKNFIDKIINNIRYKRVEKDIPNWVVICDLCCGDGEMLKKISDRIEEGYGYDKEIDTSSYKNIAFERMDLLNKFPKGKFDVVVLAAAIEHFNEKDGKSILKKSYSLLNENGKIIITTPSKRGQFILRTLLSINLCNPEILSHKYIWRIKEIEKFLLSLGFKNVYAEYFELGMNIIAIGEK